ncbi:MAG: hypothetical protein H6752_18250 [Candidatus Omnitrophica bacterium]|nr:hypothetical protein [Candidatus Omnitrophota bacterium]
MISHRRLAVSLILFWVTGTMGHAEEIELVSDPGWRTGFNVIAPTPLGKKVFQGTLQANDTSQKPQWQLAQWSSRFTLAEATPEEASDGAVVYRNAAKRIEFGDGELLLAIDSVIEYEGKARKKGEHWPHLLVEQSFADRCPPLSSLAEIDFHLEVNLEKAERVEPEGYTPNLHAAQFLLYFIVKNSNPKSEGHGDFLWLGVPLYDDRGRTDKHVIGGDVAHNKVIYMPARSAYTDRPVNLGEWITFEADLLPIAKDSLEAAWSLGKLTESKDLADYRIEGMNLGWEMPGNHRVAARVRGLSVLAETK